MKPVVLHSICHACTDRVLRQVCEHMQSVYVRDPLLVGARARETKSLITQWGHIFSYTHFVRTHLPSGNKELVPARPIYYKILRLDFRVKNITNIRLV